MGYFHSFDLLEFFFEIPCSNMVHSVRFFAAANSSARTKWQVCAILICFIPTYHLKDDEDDLGVDPTAVSQDPLVDYISGKKKVPVPTFFICGKNWHTVDQTDNFKKICPNLTFLGNKGIVDIDGLKVARLFLSKI